MGENDSFVGFSEKMDFQMPFFRCIRTARDAVTPVTYRGSPANMRDKGGCGWAAFTTTALGPSGPPATDHQWSPPSSSWSCDTSNVPFSPALFLAHPFDFQVESQAGGPQQSARQPRGLFLRPAAKRAPEQLFCLPRWICGLASGRDRRSVETPLPDLEGAAANAAAASSPASKDGGRASPSSSGAGGHKLPRKQPSSLPGGRSVEGNPLVAEGGPARSVFAAQSSTEKEGGKGVKRWTSRVLPSEEHSILLMDSTSSVSFVRKSTLRSSCKSVEGVRNTSRLSSFFLLFPLSIIFLALRGLLANSQGAKGKGKARASLLFHGKVGFEVEIVDRTVGGIPLKLDDGQLIMLPTWLTLPLPFLLFALACTTWGREHSPACLTLVFFLYSPLFVLYSTRARTRTITEVLLGRPLAFDFSLFASRDSIISSSQPVLLVIAAYAAALPYIWTLLFCFWVALWWTVVAIILPPTKKQKREFFSNTIKNIPIETFKTFIGAEKDLEGIRHQSAALVQHSALGDLYGHIAHAESCLREVKLCYPRDLSHLEGVISRVLVCLTQAQLCLSHLDEQRGVDPLSNSTNAWAVSRSNPLEKLQTSGVATGGREQIRMELEKENVLEHTETGFSASTLFPKFPNVIILLLLFSFILLFLARINRRRNDTSKPMKSNASAFMLRVCCINFINELLAKMQSMLVAEPSIPQGRRTAFEARKSLSSRSGLKETTESSAAGVSKQQQQEQQQEPSAGVASDALFTLLNQIGKEWNLNVFLLSEITNKNVLPTVGFQLKRAFLDLSEPLPVDESKWSTFVREICIRYRRAPYHNERHAGTVAHLNVWLLRHAACWNPLSSCQKLAVVVAALVHDVGHFGVNNSLLVNSNHPLAVTYNDRAVLENFHVSVAFRTMLFFSNGGANILEQLSVEQYKAVRAAIVELVLETDLASHFDFLTRFRLRMQMITASVVRLSAADQLEEDGERKGMGEEASADWWMVAKACIRSADIGHSSVNFEQHYRWSRSLMREFFSQGKQEAELGLPVSAVCDEANADVPKSQIGFIRLICQPLFEALTQADLSGAIVTVCLRQMKANSATWQRVADAGINWKSAEEVKKQNARVLMTAKETKIFSLLGWNAWQFALFIIHRNRYFLTKVVRTRGVKRKENSYLSLESERSLRKFPTDQLAQLDQERGVRPGYSKEHGEVAREGNLQ
ncbi:hypothetical protein Esti_004314 [Eimeria stiedai]